MRPVAFGIGVVKKKYGDDRGGALAAQLTYYGFLSLFGRFGDRRASARRGRRHRARRRARPAGVPAPHAEGRYDPRALAPGAALAGVGYAALLSLGAALVQRQLRHVKALYGQFGLVLGLLGWLFLLSQLVVYSAELNSVLSHRLWPRSIVQPPLTAADERVLVGIAQQQGRRPEQRVAVTFAPQDAFGTASVGRHGH